MAMFIDHAVMFYAFPPPTSPRKRGEGLFPAPPALLPLSCVYGDEEREQARRMRKRLWADGRLGFAFLLDGLCAFLMDFLCPCFTVLIFGFHCLLGMTMVPKLWSGDF